MLIQRLSHNKGISLKLHKLVRIQGSHSPGIVRESSLALKGPGKVREFYSVSFEVHLATAGI